MAAEDPDAVWQRFLDDTEQAIRASAPRELSARERVTGVRSDAVGSEGVRQERQRAAVEPSASLEAVGEGWGPEDRWPGPAWRDMDGPARRRRAVCVLGAVVAIIVAVGALSLVPTRSSFSDGAPGDSASSRSEGVLPDGAPATIGLSSAPGYAGTSFPAHRTG